MHLTVEYPELDSNDIVTIAYLKKISQPGFCIGAPGYSVFTKNGTMVCGLKNLDMAQDCLKYEVGDPGYYVNQTLILPCKVYALYDRVVTDSVAKSASNYQSPNFSIILISMMFLFIFLLEA